MKYLDLSAVAEVVVEFDLQIDLFDLCFGVLVSVQDVDISHGAVFGAKVLLHAFVQADLHFSVEWIFLVHFRRLILLLLCRVSAASENKAGG